jgi:hypothetical protein
MMAMARVETAANAELVSDAPSGAAATPGCGLEEQLAAAKAETEHVRATAASYLTVGADVAVFGRA